MTCDSKCYFVMEDPPNISLSMQAAYIQSVALTPSLLQRARDDEAVATGRPFRSVATRQMPSRAWPLMIEPGTGITSHD